MFFSKKINHKLCVAVSCTALVLLFIIVKLTACGGVKNTATSATAGTYSLMAETNEDRISFLKQFNWQVNPEPSEITQVLIPQTFNKTYEKYNEIQLKQGLDLTKYKGKSCKRISYEITNYPEENAPVRANLLIYENRVIGGDVCSMAFDGFMHGFEYEKTDR
ncbi:MAG: DUF4830 domain-containing protein [Acutalibacteraceae bacterium]